MTWNIEFLEEAKKDLKKLDHSVQLQVVKGIEKVRKNPLPTDKGGYGKPLGNKNGIKLTNLLKIKFRDLGIRVVYKLEYVDDIMKIIVISARTDEAVYKVTSLGAKKEEPAAPTTKKCPFCMSEIDIKATRCPHCTSELPEE